MNRFFLLISWPLIFCLFFENSDAQNIKDNYAFDVSRHHVRLEPDFVNKTLEGEVSIKFSVDKPNIVKFDCGNLTVKDVQGKTVKNFYQQENHLYVELYKNQETEHLVKIFYEGRPERGVNFGADQNQVYTNFFTSEWMVSHDVPNDPATIQTELVIPDSLMSISSGTLTSVKKMENGKVVHTWIQEFSTPPYTYGFVIGAFTHISRKIDGKTFHYYSSNYSEEQMEIIFKNTPDMMRFMYEKAGIPYPQDSYSQVLIGDYYQEMAGFAVLRESYGELVLKDSTETNLFSHELAHQWWGNMITCSHWGEIWLNEGMATYMSAAYNEHRFGRDKYMSDIQSYKMVYQQIVESEDDKPLVFKEWTNPTQNDRNLVYFKGAYVLHLLREKMGDQNFWNGIKMYSAQNFSQAVTTQDFQRAMENSAGIELQDFFNEWVY